MFARVLWCWEKFCCTYHCWSEQSAIETLIAYENQIEAECARAVSDLLEYEAREESNCESGTNETMFQDIDVNEAIWIDDTVTLKNLIKFFM